MIVVIDRFEGETAVVELPDQTKLCVPKALFFNCRKGDAVEILRNEAETKRRKQIAQQKLASLFEK